MWNQNRIEGESEGESEVQRGRSDREYTRELQLPRLYVNSLKKLRCTGIKNCFETCVK